MQNVGGERTRRELLVNYAYVIKLVSVTSGSEIFASYTRVTVTFAPSFLKSLLRPCTHSMREHS